MSSHDNLYHLNKFNPVADDYKLGDELNKIYADLTTLDALNRGNRVLDVAAVLAISTTNLKIAIGAAFHYTIAGGIYLKAITAAITITVAPALVDVDQDNF